MHVILPISGLATDLYHRTGHFTATRTVQPLSLESAIDVCQTIAEQEVFNRLYWTANINLLDDALHNGLHWWMSGSSFRRTTAESEVCQQYYCDLIDPLIWEIRTIVDRYVGECETDAMWYIWYSRRIGTDLLIERGSDYRVVEFERNVLSGELRTSDEVVRRITERNYIGG